VKVERSPVQYTDFLMNTMMGIPMEKYITVDCPCLCMYDNDMDLIGFSREFIENNGKA
tara:strand:- start:1469 stop:1642 length:174 start_codon:yes stop_codon:yes gene_type:complete